MHQNTAFYLLADHGNILEKIHWAERLCESYQNSSVIIRLISPNHWNSPSTLDPNITIIHHPSNRPIEPHLMILQQCKQQPSIPLCYIDQQPGAKLDEPANNQSAYQPATAGGTQLGWWINSSALLSNIKSDLKAVNQLRAALR